MRLAIYKGGTNITFSQGNASAANADILYFLRQLDIGKHDVTVVTHKTRNTVIPKRIKFQEVQDPDFVPRPSEFDAVVIFNFSLNFFGGAEDPNLIAMYRQWNDTSVPIYYIQTDGALPFRQVWPSIMKREWARKWDNREGLLYIDSSKVTVITQGHDIEKHFALYKSKPDYIMPRRIRQYPFYRTVMAKAEQYILPNLPHYNPSEKYPLMFGGYVRNAHKRKLIEHYYNNDQSYVFGNLRGVSCGLAKQSSKVSYQQFIRKMCQARSTIIIGDKWYNDNFFTLRMYESLLAGCNVFIDQQLDPKQKFYGEGWGGMYVRFHTDIQNRMELAALARTHILSKYDYERDQSLLELQLSE